jgi:hypothetical protein
MHCVYDFCDGNSGAASIKYQPRYPDQRQRSRPVFVTVHCSLTKTDAFIPRAHVGHAGRNMQVKEEMLNAVHAKASEGAWNTSLRQQVG